MKAKLLKLAGFFTDLTPLGIYVALNWDRYAPSTVETLKLTGGGLLVIAIAGAYAFTRTVPKGMGFPIVLIALSWSLRSIMNDIYYISWMLFIGVSIDTLLIKPKVDQIIEDAKMGKQAKLTAKETAKAMAVGGRNYEG